MSRITKDYKCPNCKGWNDVSERGDKIHCDWCGYLGSEEEFTSKKYDVFLKIRLSWIGESEKEVREEVPEFYNAFDIDEYDPEIIEIKEVLKS